MNHRRFTDDSQNLTDFFPAKLSCCTVLNIHMLHLKFSINISEMTVNSQINVSIDIDNFTCELGNFKVVKRLPLLCATLLSLSL